jgi:methylglutaconyl-CoA hydratase
VTEAKDLIARVNQPLDEAVITHTVDRIARLRATPEAREGMTAFLEKRKASWDRAN